MIDMIREIRKAIDNHMWYSALVLSLILPDICWKVEHPEFMDDDDGGKHYKNWFDQYIAPRMNSSKMIQDFNGYVCWKLRCHMVHEGNADNLPTNYQTDNIEIKLFDFMSDPIKYVYSVSFSSEKPTKTLSLSLEYICQSIIDSVEDFYNSSPNKEAFDAYSLKRSSESCQDIQNIAEITNSRTNA